MNNSLLLKAGSAWRTLLAPLDRPLLLLTVVLLAFATLIISSASP